MHLMRETWTDTRLDDLNEKVDRGFERLDARMDRLETRMDRLEGRMDRLEGRMDEKFDALNRLIMRVGAGIIIALVGVIATQL
jgi:predicted nuclease with TOPRIM domain